MAKKKEEKIVDNITEKEFVEAVKEETVEPEPLPQLVIDNILANQLELTRLEKLASDLAELGIGIPSKLDVLMREIKKLL